jgi:hypothetical protein
LPEKYPIMTPSGFGRRAMIAKLVLQNTFFAVAMGVLQIATTT